MLFNSYAFILFYLPIVGAGFFALARWRGARAAAAWLALASLFFYAYWDARYLALLGASIAGNYLFALRILAARRRNNRVAAKMQLTLAVSANLVALGYFKYANFLVDSLNYLAGPLLDVATIALPIGISFFTFTQVAFLVDTYQGKAQETNPTHYTLFVTYFPHLIAGPILHHSEMMPQFARRGTYHLDLGNLASGLALFTIGLFKKVVLADGIQPFVAPVFDAPPTVPLAPVAAWGGALAYSMQLYFDFSGYTDMALGLSRMFNIELPLNFNSPYKAPSIVEFWRRWHMTLSRFLRDYLYIPLGGNRSGPARRYANLMITMLLGGLWHGAGWTFVVWGGLHGLYLMINHAWDALALKLKLTKLGKDSRIYHAFSVALTFVAVTFAWVFFRATTIDSAVHIVAAMSRVGDIVVGLADPAHLLDSLQVSSSAAISPVRQLGWTITLMAVAFVMPNSQELIKRSTAWVNEHSLVNDWTRAILVGSLVAQILLLSAINSSRGVSEFIYFNF
jgi:D-alanyl-lipoteichoic acid acyltransferase DltB (MBOAT superfamily)